MATKTNFAYKAKETLVHLKTFGHFNYAILWILGWKKIKKIFGSSKIKNCRSIQDGRQNLILF
jgi:hypothetical protein